jgi:hypothetical protein
LEFNKDAIAELGHHSYEFSYKFGRECHYFRRDTLNPKKVSRCNKGYELEEEMELEAFTAWLKIQYAPELYAFTFRALVGAFSRIWPKDNVNNVRRPLHAVAGQAPSECISNLIKIFGRYREIELAQKKLAGKEDEQKALRKAVRYSFVVKIGKKQYEENKAQLAIIDREVEEIRSDLAKYALNIREIVDRELLDLKESKDLLLRQLSSIEGRLKRTERNLQENRYIKSKQFESLMEFFPEVNSKKIADIELFHSSLAVLLKKELIESQGVLYAQRVEINAELEKIDAQINLRLKNYENPSFLIDRVQGLSQKWNKLKRENELHERQGEIECDHADLKVDLSRLKSVILEEVQKNINMEIVTIVNRVYGRNSKVPGLTLKENSYSFDIVDDTGTGKAYANLVIFDLAIFSLADLPVLIHDTPLFKNVENQAVAKFVKEYTRHRKQSFIALDEIKKYGAVAEAMLIKNKVIEVSDKKVLYIKDWRKR